MRPHPAEPGELPAWRGEGRCVWRACPGRFEAAQRWPDGARLRCTACGHEHMTVTRWDDDREGGDDAKRA